MNAPAIRLDSALWFYQLGGHMADLYHDAAGDWLNPPDFWDDSREEGPDPATLRGQVGLVRALLVELPERPDPWAACHAAAFREAVDNAWAAYPAGWETQDPWQDVRDLAEAEGDAWRVGPPRVLAGSPLGGPAWAELSARLRAFQGASPCPYGTLFRLGGTLARDSDRTTPWDDRGNSDGSPCEEVNPRVPVRTMLKSLSRDLPCLRDFYDPGSLPVLFPPGTGHASHGACKPLRERIRGRLAAAARDEFGRECEARVAGSAAAPAGCDTPVVVPAEPRSTGPGEPRGASPPVGGATGPSSPPSAAPPLTPEERRELLRWKDETDPGKKYLGDSDVILRVFRQIREANRCPDLPVLLHGETGTGKTCIARLIHDSSDRTKKRFLREQAADNGSSDATLLKGRWAGYGPTSGLHGISRAGQRGLLDDAAGGTVFLDEAGDLSDRCQLLLLDVCDQDRHPILRAAGRGEPVVPDVRLILATTKDLEAEVRHGRFRHELYARISPNVIVIPPLRDRKEDIFCFPDRWCPERRRTARFLLRLLLHDWPGNVRQLRQVLQGVTAAVPGREAMKPDHLEGHLPGVGAQAGGMEGTAAEAELYVLLAGLFRPEDCKKGDGFQKRLAELLGESQPTVSRKVNRYLAG